MKTYQDLLNKWGDDINRECMSYEKELEYVNDWYKIGKHLPIKEYESNFSDYQKYKNQSFIIIGEVTTKESELCALPLWKIKFNDDNIIWADCDEIFNFDVELNNTCEDLYIITKEEARQQRIDIIKPHLRKIINNLLINEYNLSKNYVSIDNFTLRQEIGKETGINLFLNELNDTDLFGLKEEYKNKGWKVEFDAINYTFKFY